MVEDEDEIRGVVIGAVVGGVCGAVILVVIIYCCIRDRRRSNAGAGDANRPRNANKTAEEV